MQRAQHARQGPFLAADENYVFQDDRAGLAAGVQDQLAGAKQQVFELIWRLSRQGVGCIFVSSELEELIQVCHRIVVIRKGSVVAEVDPLRTDVTQLLAWCMEE